MKEFFYNLTGWAGPVVKKFTFYEFIEYLKDSEIEEPKFETPGALINGIKIKAKLNTNERIDTEGVEKSELISYLFMNFPPDLRVYCDIIETTFTKLINGSYQSKAKVTIIYGDKISFKDKEIKGKPLKESTLEFIVLNPFKIKED